LAHRPFGVLINILLKKLSGKMKKIKSDSKKLVRDWKLKLYAQGKLNDREVNKRAKEFARKGMKVEK
jgi:hypothetical protein